MKRFPEMCAAARPFGSFLLLAALICSAIYLPVVLSPFQRHDDYLPHFVNPAQDCRTTAEYTSLIKSGRDIVAETDICWAYRWLNAHDTIRSFIFLRFLNLIVLILTFAALSCWICKVCALEKIPSVLITTAVVSLPGYQMLISQGLSIAHTPCIPLTMLAVFLMRDDMVTGRWKEDLLAPKRFWLPLSLLVIVLLTYQTHALLFFVPAAAVVLFAEEKSMAQKRNIVLRHLFVFGAAVVLYFLIHKLLVLPLYTHRYGKDIFAGVGGYGTMRPEMNIPEILRRVVISLYQDRMFNLWFVATTFLPGNIFMAFTGGVFGLFLMIEGFKAARNKQFLFRCGELAQTLILLFLLYSGLQSPQFFYGDYAAYRIVMHYCAMLVMLIIWAVRYLSRLLGGRYGRHLFITLLFILSFATASVAQYQTLRDFAYLSMSEVDFLEAKIHPLLENQVSTVYIIRPRGNIRVSGDEHSMFTSTFDNTYGLPGLIHHIYRRNAMSTRGLRIETLEQDHRVVRVENIYLKAKGNNQSLTINMDILFKIHKLAY